MNRYIALAVAAQALACTPDARPPDAPPGERADPAALVATPLALNERNALRFLEQATFGPRLAHGVVPAPIDSVEHVVEVGVGQAITEQIQAPRSTFDGATTSPDLGSQFFTNAVTGSDQLRQRVAFALSQILVVSQNGIPNMQSTPESEPKLALAAHLNLLSTRSFGTYRDLLEAVTRSGAMGTYLDMANNKAFDTAGNRIEPNENHARELLQLFTLGLHKLNEDGTEQLDTNGLPLPAYSELQVQAFAHTLSGWTYGNTNNCPNRGRSNGANYALPMIGCDVNHDSRAQALLRGVQTTNGATAEQHLKEALDNIYDDPNLPPFICKQLIQHLVTSNPSPEYVQRVVNVFKEDKAAGRPRGSLSAVVRAILQDTDARGLQPREELTAAYGHLRSPALFITSVIRWMNTTLDTSAGKDPGAKLASWSRSLGQDIARAPSVFSFYPPHAPAPNGGGLLGPEFAILDTATSTARANFVHELLYSGSIPNTGLLLDFSGVPTDPTELVAWLGRYWLHGSMSTSLQSTVSNALADPRAGNTLRKQKLAVYLTSLSPEFQIQR